MEMEVQDTREIKDCLPSFRDSVTKDSSLHGCRMVAILAHVWDIPEKVPVLKAWFPGQQCSEVGF